VRGITPGVYSRVVDMPTTSAHIAPCPVRLQKRAVE